MKQLILTLSLILGDAVVSAEPSSDTSKLMNHSISLQARGLNNLKPDKYMAQYTSCADANGPINNSVVYLCADEVIKTAQREVDEKIASLMHTDLKEDIEVLLEAQELWVEYVQKQCELQAKYVGSPMISYCPMLKWIERSKELDLLLGSLYVN